MTVTLITSKKCEQSLVIQLLRTFMGKYGIHLIISNSSHHITFHVEFHTLTCQIPYLLCHLPHHKNVFPINMLDYHVESIQLPLFSQDLEDLWSCWKNMRFIFSSVYEFIVHRWNPFHIAKARKTSLSIDGRCFIDVIFSHYKLIPNMHTCPFQRPISM